MSEKHCVIDEAVYQAACDALVKERADNARLRELIRDTLCSGKYCYRVTEQKTCPDTCPAKELLRGEPHA